MSAIGEGNTKPLPVKRKKQVNPSKRWCFTLNNWTEDQLSAIVRECDTYCAVAVIGSEVGESGTPHLQGYVEFKVKQRPLSKMKGALGAHWEVSKGSRMDNYEYCTKDEDVKYLKGIEKPIPLKILKDEDLYPWQSAIVRLVKEEPDDRSIHWYWEAVGNVGKSALVKKLCAEYGAVICSGKSADIKYSIVAYKEAKGVYPKVVVYDVPRTSMQYVSYTGIEEVKGGCFMSSKYECGQVLMNSPHILIFSNSEPEYGSVSADRWKVTCIGEKEDMEVIENVVEGMVSKLENQYEDECVSAIGGCLSGVANGMLMELRSRSVNR